MDAYMSAIGIVNRPVDTSVRFITDTRSDPIEIPCVLFDRTLYGGRKNVKPLLVIVQSSQRSREKRTTLEPSGWYIPTQRPRRFKTLNILLYTSTTDNHPPSASRRLKYNIIQ